MSLLVKAGITKLSELTIDTSKNWGAYLIKNLGVAVDNADAVRKVQAILQSLLTTQGDIIHRGASVAERLGGSFGSGYNYLHSTNTGQFGVEWMDIQDLIIYLTGAVNRAIIIPSLCIPEPTISVVVTEDHSGGGHLASKTLAIPVPTIGKVVAATSVNACGGAVAHDEDGVDTDETVEANSAAINDMTLLQPDGAIADWHALGYASLYDAICVLVGTAGADITLDTFEYSKGGGSWGTLTVILNQLNNWETTGKVWFTFERPADWAVDTYAGIANMYWIKIKASAIGGGYTQPKGTQAWILVYP